MTSEEKRSTWEYVIALNQMEGSWEPSKEYMDLVEKQINGEITLAEMEEIIIKKWQR